jgi:GAF domain-containing protein
VFNPATGLYQPARERMDNGRLVIELEGVGKRTWQEADLHMAELFVEQLARDVQAAREAREAKK